MSLEKYEAGYAEQHYGKVLKINPNHARALIGMAEVKLAQTVMESFVRDMDASLRDIGVSDLRVPKRLKTLYGSFGGRMAGYRLARGEGKDALHAALARNIFTDGGNEAVVIGLANYISDAMDQMARIPRDELMNGIIDFPDANRYCSAAVPQKGE